MHSFPLERSFTPGISEPKSKDQNKGQHFDESDHSERLVGHGPGVNEKRLHVEKDEKHGEDVKADVQLDERRADRFGAALVSGAEDGVVAPRAHQEGEKKGKEGEEKPEGEKNSDLSELP